MSDRIYLAVLDRSTKERYVASCMLPLQIGKQDVAENQVLLNPRFSAISRVHGRLEASADGYIYEDQSSNGTLVYGLAVCRSRIALSRGFQLEIGDYVISQVDAKPLLITRNNTALQAIDRYHILPGRGVGIVETSEGIRFADLNRWSELGDQCLARLALEQDMPRLSFDPGPNRKLPTIKINNGPAATDSGRQLQVGDVLTINGSRFSILRPGQPYIVCGQESCQLLNSYEYASNCRWCGYDLAATAQPLPTLQVLE